MDETQREESAQQNRESASRQSRKAASKRGASNARRGGAGANKAASTKDLQKMRRVDLLHMLIEQTRDFDQVSARAEELDDLSERLKAKLDDKDAQIERLKAKLDDKDAEIERLKRQNRAYARASGQLDMHELLAVEEAAVERYLDYIAERNAGNAQ